MMFIHEISHRRYRPKLSRTANKAYLIACVCGFFLGFFFGGGVFFFWGGGGAETRNILCKAVYVIHIHDIIMICVYKPCNLLF